MGCITVLPFGNKESDFFFTKMPAYFHSAFKKDLGIKPLWLSLKELQLGGWLFLIFSSFSSFLFLISGLERINGRER